MTLLFILLNRQTFLLQKTDLPAEQLARAIETGDWSFAECGNLRINALPRCVTVLDGLVVAAAVGAGQALPEPAPPPLEVDFSPRQAEILAMLVKGMTSRAISAHLQISKRTTDGHIREIKKKLEAKTIAQTVGRAVALGCWQAKK
jgi:DNA-binding CsgD family transcriptional regulator